MKKYYSSVPASNIEPVLISSALCVSESARQIQRSRLITEETIDLLEAAQKVIQESQECLRKQGNNKF